MIELFLGLDLIVQCVVAVASLAALYGVAVLTVVWITSANTDFTQEQQLPQPTLLMWDEPPVTP